MNDSIINDKYLTEIIKGYHHSDPNNFARYHAHNVKEEFRNYLIRKYAEKFKKEFDQLKDSINRKDFYHYGSLITFPPKYTFDNSADANQFRWFIEQLGYECKIVDEYIGKINQNYWHYVEIKINPI